VGARRAAGRPAAAGAADAHRLAREQPPRGQVAHEAHFAEGARAEFLDALVPAAALGVVQRQTRPRFVKTRHGKFVRFRVRQNETRQISLLHWCCGVTRRDRDEWAPQLKKWSHEYM
jgi:hypothetical protein